jgi:hypothetical protein
MIALSRTGVFAFACALLAFAASIAAQEQRGTVKVDSLDVYSQMSSDSDAISTLARGTSVRITLSITNGEGSWCSISKIDTSEKLGFVHCDGLDRENTPSTAASAGGTGSASPSFASQPPSRAQKAWAIAASAILATFNRESPGTLSSGGDPAGTRKLLHDAWGISSRNDLLGALAWIEQGGHRQLFSELGARTSKASPEQLKDALSRLNSENANSVRVAHRYYEKFGTQSITAWDFARYINLCRWGIAAGYISEDEAWPRVMYAAGILQQTFGSWSEFGQNYLVGREFWSLHQTGIDGQAMRAICQRLLSDPGSPWNRIPWSLPLQ